MDELVFVLKSNKKIEGQLTLYKTPHDQSHRMPTTIHLLKQNRQQKKGNLERNEGYIVLQKSVRKNGNF